MRFQVYFTPLPGFFSPFPHGTSSLSVDNEYLALEDGPPVFGQDSTCPALLVLRLVSPQLFRLRGYHPLWPDFPDSSARAAAKSQRLVRFRSPLLSESRLISVPLPTEMFQFRRFASLTCQLPEAYRRLQRPSSPVVAKASTTCTCSLDPITLSTGWCLPQSRL
jgi:hypothetical protein